MGLARTDFIRWILDETWTLDKMIELSEGVYRDLVGDGVKSKGDQFGFVAANTQSQPLVWGCRDHRH